MELQLTQLGHRHVGPAHARGIRDCRTRSLGSHRQNRKMVRVAKLVCGVSTPAVDRYLLLAGGALHVTAHPGDGRAAVVFLDVGVVFARGEVRGDVRDVIG